MHLTDAGTPHRRWALAALVALAAVAVGLRLTEASDVHDKDQPGVLGHAVDVAVNDAWLVQWEVGHGYATKPPMYPWLAGLGLKLTGWRHPFVFKWPSLAAAAVTVVLVYRIARPAVGRGGGLLASAVFLANPVTHKLMYVARTDAVVTMLLTLAAWAAIRMREAWNDEAAEHPRAPLGLVAAFWVATAAAALTKGPVAAMPIAFLLGLVVWDGGRGWARCRPGWQAVGLAVAVGLPLTWLGAVLQWHPDYVETLRGEMGSRVVGTSDAAYRPWLAVVYAVTRFVPWSPMAVAGGAAVAWGWLASRRDAGLDPERRDEATWWRRLGPAAAFVVVVIGVLMLATTQRPDRLMPAYPMAAVLAAAVAVDGARRWNPPRVVAAIVVGLVGVAGVAAAGSPWYLPGPGPIDAGGAAGLPANPWPTWNFYAGAMIAGAAGLVTLGLLTRGRLRLATWAACFAAIGLVAVEADERSEPARTRHGDQLLALVERVRAVQAQRGEPLPLAFHHTGYAPIQSLLGRNTPADDAQLDRVGPAGGLVITSRPEVVEARFEARAEAIARTATLKQPGRPLVLFEVAAAGQ